MMTLTTRGRYAARIMVFLAGRYGSTPSTKFEIANAEDLSANYVEQIMLRLKAARLVRSHRGKRGGFSLTRDPATIKLSAVLRAVEGPVSPVPCLHEECQRASACPTRPVWEKTAEAVKKIFAETTIAQLVKETAARNEAAATYQI